MVPKKRASKRQTLQAKFRIVKRTKEHKKRLKKGAVVNFSKKPKVQNHIPNNWPYKEDLLKEIQNAKDKMEAAKIKKKEERKSSKMNVDEISLTTKKPVLNIPVNPTEETSDDEVDGSMDIKTSINLGQNSRRAYLKELRKLVEAADVILHVLDARDPLGTRSSTIEEMVLSKPNKRLVFILNKSDLVPREVLAGWLTYLRKFHPTLPFKSNTQNQKGNLGSVSGKVGSQHVNALQGNQAVGAEELLGLLKNYARSGDTKTIISVGCVGFPNVGKSSLINSCLRSRAVGVSSTPGFTKKTQEVILDKTVRMIDSPGIVFADGDSAAVTLRNCVHVESLEDVLTPVQAILEKCPQPYLMQLYSISTFEPNNVTAFLALVARTSGKLKKGGIPDINAAAKVVLHDWNDGKIKYYVMPPKFDGKSNSKDSVLMSEYSDEFDIGELGEEDIRVLNKIEEAADNSEGGMGTFIPIQETNLVMNFGAKDGKVDPISNVTKTGTTATTGFVKLSKKSISASAQLSSSSSAATPSVASTSGRRAKSDKMSEVETVGTALTHLTNAAQGGVLSRKQINGSSENVEVSKDSRKIQKLEKKKSKKDVRRESSGSTDSNQMQSDYDFSSDFQY